MKFKILEPNPKRLTNTFVLKLIYCWHEKEFTENSLYFKKEDESNLIKTLQFLDKIITDLKGQDESDYQEYIEEKYETYFGKSLLYDKDSLSLFECTIEQLSLVPHSYALTFLDEEGIECDVEIIK